VRKPEFSKIPQCDIFSKFSHASALPSRPLSPEQIEARAIKPEQLNLFHWWNAYPEEEPFGTPAHRLPVHEDGFVCGRSGFQWVQSIIAYLAWREGAAWRPESHRFNPVREHFVECVSIVQRAYFGNARWFNASNRVPRLPRPKPVVSANAKPKKKGIA
jgi:hypothetical protein